MGQFTTTARRFLLAIGISLAASQAAQANLLELQASEAPVEELVLSPDAELGGQSVLVRGTADELGVRYYVMKLDVMSPIVLRVFADDPARPVKISLHRHLWDKADGEGMTDDEGNFEFTGRIDDELGIWLTAEEPADFHLLFWMGDPVPVEVPPMFFTNGQPVRPPEEK